MADMRRLFQGFIFFLILIVVGGCSLTSQEIKKTDPMQTKLLNLVDISAGLPRDGLWRENIEINDINGDGYLDIIAPPPRKATDEQKRPFIFHWNTKDGRWIEGKYNFPDIKGINYGGIATGDLNNDNFLDIVVASHSGRIVVLINNQHGGFVEQVLPIKEVYYSRAVVLNDINNDGWLDIIAVSEGPFVKGYTPKGILIALNREGKDWDINLLKDSMMIFSDSIVVKDINYDGRKDILIAPLILIKEYKKPIWLQEMNNTFSFYPSDIFGDNLSVMVRAGAFDGDGKDGLVFLLSGLGDAGVWLTSFKWQGDAFREISSGLKIEERPLVFDLFDIDKDGKDELIVLTTKGFKVFKYSQVSWDAIWHYPIPEEDVKGASDLKVRRQPDGSIMFFYNLGTEMTGLNKGLRAYLLK